jgi:serine protease Do
LVPQDITADERGTVGTSTGAYVKEVVVGGPADKGGIQAGDVITKIGGTPIVDEITLRDTVGSTAPGSKVDINYLRDGKARTTAVMLGEIKETQVGQGTAPNAPAKAKSSAEKYGFTVSPLSDDDKTERGIPKTTVGVQVATVSNGSPADDAGLVPGAVITHANGTILSAITDVDAVLKANPRTVRLQVIGGRSESAGGSGLTRGLIVIRLR